MNIRFLYLISLVLIVTACSKETSTPSEQTPNTQELTSSPSPDTSKSSNTPSSTVVSSVTNTAITPPSMAPAASTATIPGQSQGMPAVAAETPSIEGVVASIIEVADSKTMYLEIDQDGKKQWVGAKLSDIKQGDRVRVAPGAVEMQNFTSKSLGRTFDVLLLASDVEKLE